MSDINDYRPGDSEPNLLRKILSRLGAGVSLTGQSSGVLTVQSSGAFTVGGSLVVVAQEFTRPNNATPYAINEAVNDNETAGSAHVIGFANVGRANGGTGYITNVRIVKSTNVTTNASFRLWLYSVSPAPLGDNAAFTLLYANKATRLGYVDFALTTEGAGSDSASAAVYNVNLKFNCAADSRALYGVLETKAAYTPGALEKFWVELTADQN